MNRWITNHRKLSTAILALSFITYRLVMGQMSEVWGVFVSTVYVGVVLLIGWRLAAYKLAQFNEPCSPADSVVPTRRKWTL